MIISWIDQQSDYYSQLLGLPDDQMKLISSLLVSYPIGFIFKRIPSPIIRHVFGILLGFFYQYLIYRSQTLHPFLLAALTYFTLKIFGRQRANIVFVGAIIYLSLVHMYVMYHDWGGWRMDITIIMMIFVCRCTSFAWSYKDGGVEESKLSTRQIKYRIVELPSFFHFLSFVYFYGGAVVGPSYDFNDHQNFIYRRGEYAKVQKTFLPSLAYLLSSFVALAIVVLFSDKYNQKTMITQEFADLSFFDKYIYLTITEQVHRFKYFTAWLMATANVTGPGLNYNPEGKTFFQKFGKIVAVRPIDHQIGDNVRDKLEAWNTPSQLWLRNDVYLRIVSEEEARKNPSKATFASNITFMVSAFWHGFYPNYYVAFFFMFLFQQIWRILYRARDRLRWVPEPIGFIIRWVITNFMFDFIGVVFALLDFHKAISFFRAWNFIPVIMLLTSFFILSNTNIAKSQKNKEKVKVHEEAPSQKKEN